MTAILRLAAVLAVLFSVSHSARAEGGVLVFGGNGRLGYEVVKLLLDASEDVTVFVRPTSDRSRLEGLDVSYAVGDMLNEKSVAAALRTVKPRVIIDTASARNTPGFFVTSQGYIATYAKEASVEQIIHHGSVGAGDNMEQFPHINFEPIRSRLLDKGEGEKVIMSSGLTYTIIRNAMVWPHGTPATDEVYLSEDHSTFTGVTRRDLANLTMDCLDNPTCANKVYHAVDESLPQERPSRRRGATGPGGRGAAPSPGGRGPS